MHATLTVALAFVASTLATRALIDWLNARQLVAVENDRTMHSGQVPQGGGLAVIAVSLTTALLLWPWSPGTTVLVPTAIGLAALSAANDARDISFPWRLAAHLLAACVAVALIPSEVPILGGWLPLALDRIIAVLALTWFINLYNFMDGIDGIAGVETMTITGGALCVLWYAGASSPLEGLALAIFGASAGFLVWNWHKARIFLGDVGSIPLGFLLGAMLIHLATAHSLAAAVILPLYYLTDATLTLVRRMARSEKIWQPHRSHTYQRAARALGSHSAVVWRIIACNLVLIAAAVAALEAPVASLIIAVSTVAVLMWHLESIPTTPIPSTRA